MAYLIPINLIPILMIIFGALFINHAPKDINSIYGYRTPMSRKNKDTWQFAHHYCGGLWCIFGIALLIISSGSAIYLNSINKTTFDSFNPVFIIGEIIVMLLTILLTEIALRKNFDKNGNLK